MADSQVLGILSNNREKNLALIRERAASNDLFGSNGLKALVAELRALSPQQVESKYGLKRDDIMQIDMIRSQTVKRLPKDQVIDGIYFPGQKEKIAQVRKDTFSKLEKEMDTEASYQRGIRNRSLPESFAVGLEAAAKGWLAPGMAREWQRRGMPVQSSFKYIDWNDPLQASMAIAGYGLNQGQIPSISSVPGNLVGGRLGGGLGTAIGRAFGGGAAAGWLGGAGGLLGGLGGAMATGALGNKYLNPMEALSKENQQIVEQQFTGPERTLGEVASPLGIFSIRQGPGGNFFEGGGARAGLTSLISKRGALGRQEVIAPATDAGSRIAQAFQTQGRLSDQNEDARRRFFDDNGYEAVSEEELIPYGFTSNAGKLSQAFMDLALGGFGPAGRAVSGEAIGDFVSTNRNRAEAKRILDQVKNQPGATSETQAKPSKATARVAPFGIFRVNVPTGTKEGKTAFSRVNVTYTEGDKPSYGVKPGMAAMLPKTQQGVASELRKTPAVESEGKFVNIVGVSPTGEIFVTTQDDAQNTVVKTALYGDLPPALQKQVDKASQSSTAEGTPLPKWDAVLDTAYAPTQDAHSGYRSAFPNTINIDGVDVNARVLKIDDADSVAQVVLPSGSLLYIDKDLINVSDAKAPVIGVNNQANALSTATDDKGRNVFGQSEVRGEKFLTYRKEGSRETGLSSVNMNDFVVQEGAAAADKSNVGMVVDLGKIKVGGVTRSEVGVVVGVDSFKIGDKDGSGYWVQSMNDPLAKPFLVTQEFIDSQKVSGQNQKGVNQQQAQLSDEDAKLRVEVKSYLDTHKDVRKWWESIGSNADEWKKQTKLLMDAVKSKKAAADTFNKFKKWFEKNASKSLDKSIDDAFSALSDHERFGEIDKADRDAIDKLISDAKSSKFEDKFKATAKATDAIKSAIDTLDNAPKPPSDDNESIAKQLVDDLDAALTAAKATSQWASLDAGEKRNIGGLIHRLKAALSKGQYEKIEDAKKELEKLKAFKGEQQGDSDAERKAKEEAERKAKEEAERKAKEEAERKAKEEAERKAKEEAERKAKEEAERKAKEEAERKAKEEAERKAKEEAAKKKKNKKKSQRPEGAPEWPEGYRIDVKRPGTETVIYSETFGDVAEDVNLPPEMRSDQRGDEYYRYRQMTAGEQAENLGDVKNIPRQFLENIRVFSGRIKDTIKGKGPTAVDFEFDLQKITSREDLVSALKRVFNQTDDQAEALANVADRFATGWSLEMMRLSGVGTQNVYRAARTTTELEIARKEKISSYDRKNEFREQSALRNDKETLETLKKLRTYFYAQRLGNIAALTEAQAKQMGTPGFTIGWRGTNQVVNVAFALSGQRNYVAQVHEVTHLLMRSMYAPMYHQLAASVMRTYGMSHPQFDFNNPRRIDGSVEERVVTAFLRAMATSNGKRILDEGRKEGGAGHDVSINQALNQLGAQLKMAAEAMGPKDVQNILAQQGWSVSLKTDDAGKVMGYYPVGTSFLFTDTDNQVKELVLEQEWNAETHPNATLLGYVISHKLGKYSVEHTNKRKSRITQTDLNAIGQLRATMGRPVVELQQGKEARVAEYVINDGATKYLSQFFGHWGEWTNELLNRIDPVPVIEETFIPESKASIQRFAFGYRWWKTPADYRDATSVTADEFSDARIYARSSQSYLGWLDAGGYEKFLTADEIMSAEWGVLIDIEDSRSSETESMEDKAASANAALSVLDDMDDIFGMSTYVPSEPKERSASKVAIGDLIRDFLTLENGTIADIQSVKERLIDGFVALPIIRSSVIGSWNKTKGLEDIDRPLFLSLDEKKLKKQLTVAQSASLNDQWKKFSNREVIPETYIDEEGDVRPILTESGRPRENVKLGLVQQLRAAITKDINHQLSTDAKEGVRKAKARYEYLKAALNYELKPKDWYERMADRLGIDIDLELRVSDPTKFRNQQLSAAIQFINDDLDASQTIPTHDQYEFVLDDNGEKIPVLDASGQQKYEKTDKAVIKNGKLVFKNGEQVFETVNEPVFERRLVKRGLLTEKGMRRNLETTKEFGVAELRSEYDPTGQFENMSDEEFYRQYLRRVNLRFVDGASQRLSELLPVMASDKKSNGTSKSLADRRSDVDMVLTNLQSLGLYPSGIFPSIGAVSTTADETHPLKREAFDKVREHKYRLREGGREYVYRYTIGTPTKPGYSEAEFKRQYLEQDRDIDLESTDPNQTMSQYERNARAMFHLGYDQFGKLPKMRELLSPEKSSGPQYSRGLDFLNDVKLALQDELQFARTIDGVIHYLEVERNESRRVVGATWVAVTPEELSDRLLKSAYNAIGSTINDIRRQESSVTSVGPDVKRQAFTLVRDFVSTNVMDSSNVAETEITYLSAYKALTNWRKAKAVLRSFVALNKQNVGKYISGKDYSASDAKALSETLIDSIQKLQEVARKENWPRENFKFMVESSILSDEKFRFIPAIAEWQFRNNYPEQQRVDWSVRYGDNYTVEFADVSGEDANKLRRQASFDLEKLNAVNVVRSISIQDLMENASGEDVGERVDLGVSDEAIAAIQEHTGANEFAGVNFDLVDAASNIIDAVDVELQSFAFRESVFQDMANALWPTFIKNVKSKISDQDWFRSGLSKVDGKSFTEIQARINFLRNLTTRNTALAAASNIELETLQKYVDKFTDNVRKSSDKLYSPDTDVKIRHWRVNIVMESIRRGIEQTKIGDRYKVAEALQRLAEHRISRSAPIASTKTNSKENIDVLSAQFLAFRSLMLNEFAGISDIVRDTVFKSAGNFPYMRLMKLASNESAYNAYIEELKANWEIGGTKLQKENDLASFAGIMDAWSVIAAGLRKGRIANSLDILVDNASVVDLLPSLSIEEVGVLRMLQAQSSLDAMKSSTSQIAAVLNKAEATVRGIKAQLYKKIAVHESKLLRSIASDKSLPDQASSILNNLRAVVATEWADQALPDEKTPTEKILRLIEVSLKMTGPEKEITDNDRELFRIWQSKGQWAFTPAKIRFIAGNYDRLVGAVSAVSVMRPQQIATSYDDLGRMVYAGSTSDSLGSTSQILALLRGENSILSVRDQNVHVSAIVVPTGSTLYSKVIERLNGRGIERKYLTNAELRAIALANRGKVSDADVVATLQKLIKQRDDMVVNPLKKFLEQQNMDANLASATINTFNEAMDSQGLSDEDRLIAMSAVLNASTRQNEPDLVAWMLLNKRLPTESEYLEIKGIPADSDKAPMARNSWKDLESLQKSVGINAIVDGVVGSKLTVIERSKAEAERQPVIAFALDLRPQDLPLTESIAQTSIAYQGHVIEDFVNQDGSPTLGQLTATNVKDALDKIRSGVSVSQSPLRLAQMPGAPKTGERLGGKLASDYKQKPGEEEEVNRAKIGARVLRIGIDSIRDVTSIIDGNGSDKPLSEMNPLIARAGQRKIEAAWTRAAAIDAIDPQSRALIGPKLEQLAKALTKNILDARQSILAAMRVNSDLDQLTYTLVEDPFRQIVAATDANGKQVFEIDFNNARVMDMRGATAVELSASKTMSIGIPSKTRRRVNMTEAQFALYDLLTTGIDQDLGVEDGTFERVAQAVLATSTLKSVPPVYWHAQLRVQPQVSDNAKVEPMYLSTFVTDPVTVNNSVGITDESTRQDYVYPVIKKWLQPDLAGLQRVAINMAGEPFFDGEGYTVWREDGKRSHVFARLIDHGLSPDKALEIYALTEHPKFKAWAAGDLIESPLMRYPGSMMNQGRVKFAGATRPIQQAMAAQDLVSAIDRFIANPTDENFDDFAFAYDEVDAFGVGTSDKDLVNLMTSIKQSPDRELRMGIIKDKASYMLSLYSTQQSSTILNSYRAYKESEQPISTGKPFHTLAFPHTTDSFIGVSRPGISSFDLGSGLYKNNNRKNRPTWIKFENPLVYNVGNTNIDVETMRRLTDKAKSANHDGIVLMNVIDTINNTTRRNIAVTLNDANILPVSRMTLPLAVDRKAKDEDVELMYLSTPMYAPLTSEEIPPLLPEDVTIRQKTGWEKLGKAGAILYDNLMSFARSPLSQDIAFSFIQAGKAGLGFVTGRPQDTGAWIKAAFGSLPGLAPNLQVSIAGKKIGYDKLGRRQWLKIYQEIRKDPDWEVMKALKVPMHFMNFERKLEAERVRLYTEGKGETAFDDIQIDMLAYDERGNLDDVFESNTLVSMLPLAGMWERQMSLQHDLLMYHQVKWQLRNNPELRALMESEDAVEAVRNNRTANAMVGFIATSMGDFQYTTNDKVDIWASRIGKAIWQAPRWYASNIAIAWPVSLVIDNIYRDVPAFRKFVGPNNRSIGLYNHQNKELRAYQLKTWLGTMTAWLIAALGAMAYGRFSRRADFDWNLSKGLGMFRLGDWEISESTGSLDAINQIYGIVRDFGRGGIGTKPRLGETSEEAENAGFLRAMQRLGYKKSPLITFLYDKVYRGRDALNRAVYVPNEEFLFAYEGMMKEVLTPIFKMAGVKLWDAEELPLSSMILTQQVPTAWQDAWSAYTSSYRSTAGHKESMRKAMALQYFWSFIGTRVKYSPYVPDEFRQMYNKQWMFKRFMEQQGPTGPELLKDRGLSGWFQSFKTGK